jgi:hypothetical protein
MKDQEYIGDGVYVGHDGWHIWLYANHHENPTDKIALEPEVYERLLAWVEKLSKQKVASK